MSSLSTTRSGSVSAVRAIATLEAPTRYGSGAAEYYVRVDSCHSDRHRSAYGGRDVALPLRLPYREDGIQQRCPEDERKTRSASMISRHNPSSLAPVATAPERQAL